MKGGVKELFDARASLFLPDEYLKTGISQQASYASTRLTLQVNSDDVAGEKTTQLSERGCENGQATTTGTQLKER